MILCDNNNFIRSAKYFSGRRGLTLLELLLGLLIFAVVMGGVYSTFFGAVRLDEQAEVISRMQREANWSLDKITEDLENMTPFDFSISDPDKTAFVGTENSMELFVPTEEGLRAVRYSLQGVETQNVHKVIIGQRTKKNVKVDVNKEERQARVVNLLRIEKTFAEYSAGAKDRQGNAEILSGRVQEGSLKFSYAYLEGEGEAAKIVWKSSWGEKFIPGGVRIEMTLLSPGKKPEPLLLVRDVFIPTGSWGKTP
ncbi:MAG: hypothetical protein A2787_02525 [Omnitrophica WOR_2 bacterium RIFCSPHIGHO2_01_FULL_48_9]|nr:MAG: hypothetical protein A3D10_01715 [Omnitrophica WOR_2 bacterium RIFCSPHIGHO2_02_FULL_48_11]OGX32500.1 MAG: hypothetical protein A2787_02525 [Omnitrophica WOR_2 bacterium RIFCSPHIGHO2_01_FULL_48_9]